MNTAGIAVAHGNPAGPASAALDKLSGALKQAFSEPNLVQSSMGLSDTGPATIDIFEIERQARALRAAYMLRSFKAMLFAIDQWFTRRAQNDLESYLASSQNLADLESRMRRYGDQHSPFNAA
jgi:hypothetical protein